MTSISQKDFFLKYQKLNRAYSKKLIFQLTDRGFASEMNSLLLSVLYCLVFGEQLVIYDRNWNSGRFKDYYKPFCKSYYSLFRMPSLIFSSTGRRRQLYLRIHKILYPNRELLTVDKWASIYGKEWQSKRIFIPDLDIDGDVFHALYILEKNLFQLNIQTSQILKSKIDSICVSNISGIHVRRGDKLIREAKHFDLEKYINEITKHADNVTKVFIATDTYEAIEELKIVYPAIEIISNCEKTDLGHFQKKFNNSSKEIRFNKTIGVILDILILTNCQVFVGTFSSNIGRLVHLKRNGKMSFNLDDIWRAG